ncbi:MAG: hypothetical protein QG660_1058, partial [Pseudomonadota bacterium]|nr:hypothetical protein [Pseudomonadota bacterium]
AVALEAGCMGNGQRGRGVEPAGKENNGFLRHGEANIP